MSLPAHPDNDPDTTPNDAKPRGQIVLIAAGVVALVAVIVILHLTGIIGG